jgi:ribosomal protein S18 acetylase RimI-like enzyme
MLIKTLTEKDIPAWLALAHEGDEIIARMIPDLAVFYADFDGYMERKIKQQEAFMAYDVLSYKCLGIIAFSKNNNRITFLGIARTANYPAVGKRLMEHALNQLDNTGEITASVLKLNVGIFQKERELYKSLGFMETDDKIMESGVPAGIMKKNPGEKVRIGAK